MASRQGSSGITVAAWAQALDAIEAAKERRFDGCFSRADYCQRYGLRASAGKSRIADMLRAGVITKVGDKIIAAGGQVPMYRVTEIPEAHASHSPATT